MYKLIFLILFPFYLNSTILTLNVARDHNQSFSVIHLDSANEFFCKEELDKNLKKILICTLSTPITKRKQPIENLFFKINFMQNRVIIVPKGDLYFYNFNDNFIDSNKIYTDNTKASAHWIIIGSEKNSTLFGKVDPDNLNFPLTLAKEDPPYIGELDQKLLPVVKESGASFVRKLKVIYKKGDDKILISKVEQGLDDLENPFKSIAKLYKIRSISRLIFDESDSTYDPMDLVEESLDWLDDNPSNAHIPEILSIITKAYYKMGRSKGSEKYLQTLKNQFANSQYYFDALMYQGDRNYLMKDNKGALKSYKKVLYNTNDMKTASYSAMKIANIYLDQNRSQNAKNLLKKVLKSDPKLLNVDTQLSYKLAKKFADHNDSNLSVEIIDSLDALEDLDQDELLKNIAYWSELSNDKERAFKLYKVYLEKFPDGKYLKFVQKRLDNLLLYKDEENQTKRIGLIDKLIDRYKDDKLSKKALIEKAKILLEQKEYRKILALRDLIKDKTGKELLYEVSKKIFIEDLNEGRCKEALELKSDYNLSTPMKLKPKLYDCYKKAKEYQKALQIAKELEKKSDDLAVKAKYLYEIAKLYKELDNYKAFLLAVNDLNELGKVTDISKYDDLCLDSVRAYYHLQGLEDLLLNEVVKCEKRLKDDVRLLDVYDLALAVAKKKNDTKMIEFYAKKMIDMQKKYKINTFSPVVEIDYVEALKKDKKYDKALQVVIDLLYQKLNDTQRAHVLYLGGYLSEKLNKIKEAKEFYSKCGEIVEDSAWVQLCAQNLDLLDQ